MVSSFKYNELLLAAEDMLRGGEHEGPCTNDPEFGGYQDEGCQKHIDTYNTRLERLRKAVTSVKSG